VIIREATEDDVGLIHRLIVELATFERLADEVQCTEADLLAALFGPQCVCQVSLGVQNDEVVGYALWYRTFSTFLGRSGIWLEDLYVREEARHHGYGRALLEHLRSLTEGRVEWEVLDWNDRAIAFYESIGARAHRGWTKYRWITEG
jgi:GNAT superfamily N-acetyltransferase